VAGCTVTGRVAGLATAHLLVAAALLTGATAEGAVRTDLAELVGFTAAFALVGLLPLQLGLRRGAGAVTLVEAVLVTAVFSLPPVAVAGTAALGGALAAATWGERPGDVTWAAARSAGAASVAAAAFAVLDAGGPLDPGSWLAAGAAAAAFAAVNFASTAAVSAAGRRSFDEAVRAALSTVAAATGIATATGLAAVVLAEANPLAPVLLTPMAGVVIAESQRQVRARAALRHQLDLNDEKSEFVAAVSHDLRTPLTAALASIETIQRLSGHIEPEMTGELLERAGEQGRRLQRLVEQLLLVTAAEHGAVEIVHEPVDPAALARRAATELAGATGRRVVVTGRSSEGLVLLDPDKVWRIVVNLVENAAKYAPAGPIELSVTGTGEWLELTVADRGPGVPADLRSRIFERFVHVDPADGGTVEGTGLGLYLCRRLALLMGGTLDVADRTGGGAVFVVRLPRRTPTEPALPGPAPPAPALAEPATPEPHAVHT
jgi:two-component system sensor histidine kinase KdpD